MENISDESLLMRKKVSDRVWAKVALILIRALMDSFRGFELLKIGICDQHHRILLH